MIIAIDFDGTIVEHEYPRIGKPVPFALQFMREFQVHGTRLILWTMRSGEYLTAAVEYCRENGIEFYGVNANPAQVWSSSPKAYANIYIDDAAFGCPLLHQDGKRPTVDWLNVGPAVIQSLPTHRPEQIIENDEPSAIDAVRHPERREARRQLLEAYKGKETGLASPTSIVPNMIAAVHQSTARTKTPERDALGAAVSKLAIPRKRKRVRK